jgi:hypothetical protein
MSPELLSVKRRSVHESSISGRVVGIPYKWICLILSSHQVYGFAVSRKVRIPSRAQAGMNQSGKLVAS